MTKHVHSFFLLLLLCGCATETHTNKEISSTEEPSQNFSDKDKLVTVDFQNEEIGVIITMTAELFDLNLVIPDAPEMKKRISCKAKQVSWATIFKTSLDQINYTYAIEGNVVNVIRKHELLKK